ncbi:MAG: tripartite tricarboxylate transporter substrate binding protein [Xanthobacteraceae bacterium]|nr:tripartite tricarboxylate transporter substrate binding protein [Xanthobacteraceae bacterium]
MKLSRRRILRLASGAAALPLTMRNARAQAYPTQPITLVHGLAPGGGVDTTARIVADGLSRRLGQQVIVQSKPGASSTLASAQLARAAPDGHTLGFLASTYATAAAMHSKLPFRPVDDFAMLGQVIEFPLVVASHADHAARSISDLIKMARTAESPLLYGTPGLGSIAHLLVEHLAQQAKCQFQHVPYRGGGAQALTELLARRIDFMVDPPIILLEHVRNGTVRILAVTTATRVDALPDIPAIAEAGFPQFDVSGWMGLVGPAGLPERIVHRLNSALVDTLVEPGVVQRIRALGNKPRPSTPDELKARIAAEILQWSAVIDAAKIERI